MEEFKIIQCWECHKPIRAELCIGEREILDGYHGRCKTCGWNFEPIKCKQLPDFVHMQYSKELIKWARDRYWDSLEKDKDLVLHHLQSFAYEYNLTG